MPSKLASLFMDRCKAYEAMPVLPMARLDPETRALADQQSARFRELDAEIVQDLLRRKVSPSVNVNGKTVQFRLTPDRLNFYPADLASGRPLVWSSVSGFTTSANIQGGGSF